MLTETLYLFCQLIIQFSLPIYHLLHSRQQGNIPHHTQKENSKTISIRNSASSTYKFSNFLYFFQYNIIQVVVVNSEYHPQALPRIIKLNNIGTRILIAITSVGRRNENVCFFLISIHKKKK